MEHGGLAKSDSDELCAPKEKIASYLMGTGGSSLGVVKRPGREADHLPLSSAEVKECLERYLCSPIRLHGVVS
jgi:hypothetical protein